MWFPVHGAPASANTHGKAAAGGGRLPTRVGKEFVQGGFGPASTTLSAGGQLKQGCCKGSLRCDGQDATPPHDPRCPCRSPERGRHFCCTRAGQQADESCCFRGPPSAYLEPEHNQAAAACPLELRVSLALFAASSSSSSSSSSSARAAGERFEENVSNARSSQAWAARRCHPRRWSHGSSWLGALV